jgi:inorganic triphosphatase YgiF
MRAAHVEIESKLIAPDAAALRPLRRLLHRFCNRVRYLGVEPIRDVYLDTDGWDILRSGYACRVRRVRDAAVLTFKSVHRTTKLLRVREEFEEPLAVPLPENLARLPCKRLRAKLVTLTGGRPLRVLFRLRNRRRTYAAVTDEGSELHVSADNFTLVSGRKERTLYEIEVEMHDGRTDCLRRLTRRLHDALGFPIGGRSKFREGLRLAKLRPPR